MGLHLRCHREKTHQCPKCDKKFRERQHLRIHIKDIHDKTGYSCKVCNKVLSSKAGFDRHKLVLHDKVQEVLKATCEKCGKRFKYHSQLTQHIKKAHSEEEI